MLSPSEIGQYNSGLASLFCAITPIRSAPVVTVQKRRLTRLVQPLKLQYTQIPRACGTGWSKQLIELSKRV